MGLGRPAVAMAWLLAALAAVTLQGCLQQSPDAAAAGAPRQRPSTETEDVEQEMEQETTETTTTEVASDTGPEPLQVCPSITFGSKGGYVSESQAGDVVEVLCPVDTEYGGPTLVCGWVDRFCVAESEEEVNPNFCWDQYNLTLEGHGLESWPTDVSPQLVPPPLDVVSAQDELDEPWIAPDADDEGPAAQEVPAGQAGQQARAGQKDASRRLASSGRLRNSSGKVVHKSAKSGKAARVRGHKLPEAFVIDDSLCVPESYTDLDMAASNVVFSNLGGVGPNHGEQALVYEKVAVADGNDVDLVVTTSSEYKSARPDRNGKGSTTGRININGTHAVPLWFRFVETGTNNSVALKKVFLSLFNIVVPADEGEYVDPESGAGDLQVAVDGAAEYFRTSASQVGVHKLSDGRYVFGRPHGTAVAPSEPAPDEGPEDDKESVMDMWLDSLNRSIALVFRNVSQITLHVRVPPSPHGSELEFAGWSEVAELGRKVFCEGETEFEGKFASPAGSGSPVTGAAARPQLEQRAAWLMLGCCGVAGLAVALVVGSHRRKARGELIVVVPQGQYGVLRCVA